MEHLPVLAAGASRDVATIPPRVTGFPPPSLAVSVYQNFRFSCTIDPDLWPTQGESGWGLKQPEDRQCGS